MYDPDLYRSRAEVEQAKRRDPIDLLTGRLGLSPAERATIDDDATARVDEAVAFAERGTPEPVADLERFLYAETPA
jgi:TPP-dependent pyruvate/acetoin dehydrogenase alpha subunit